MKRSNRIDHQLLDDKNLHRRHLGLQPFRDSHTTLTLLHIDLYQARKEKGYILGVAIDLQAAYDSVYEYGFIYECTHVGIYGRLLRCLHRFLSRRSIK